MQILYKKDTKGKIRYLKISVEGSELVQASGIVGTESPVEHRKTCKAKNVGRSNVTTPQEQAISEMNSKIADKLTEGYCLTLEDLEKDNTILPMLAKDYHSECKKIDWSNAYIQPKLDGMRCLAHIKSGTVTLISRDGKLIENMQHIMNDLSSIKEYIILDGELYAHGLTFQENMKLIKKLRENTSELIKFHVYDIITDSAFHLRTFRKYLKGLKTCCEVSTYKINSEEELKEFHSLNISGGYEGSIIRWGDNGYKINGRSSNLLKYKDFKDIALSIVDIIPSEQRPSWGQPIFEINGKKFSSGMKYSHEEREEFLTNKQNYINKTAELRFFEYTDDGIPRFPVMVGIRLDK